ncbi:MAG: SPFH domain-containing protein [Syntrophomonadaceae bacterium]|nr:SPFH domain-containing protein [Syntrophomonadaceae bacterium]
MTETKAWRLSGYVPVLALLALAGGGLYFLIRSIIDVAVLQIIFSTIILVITGIISSGLTIVHPNEAKAVVFFGSYAGSIRDSGLWLTLPLSTRQKVSLRIQNFNSKTLKVNDIEGNPIEIGAVVVFMVVDSARALFDVNEYEAFVEIQSEAALRYVATKYPYDTFDDDTAYSLRGNVEEVAKELALELQNRLAVAGVQVLEARLTHLAYATEIASAMLQRQQATAIIAARKKIVEGAVGMVQLALAHLQRDGIVELDEERRATMVNNLLVAIVSERSAQPVINTGSLY